MLLVAALMLAQESEPPPWARFSVTPMLRGAAVNVRVGIVPRQRRTDPVDYWFERTIRPQYHPVMLSSTDSRQCPAARAVMGEMADVPAPRFRPNPDGPSSPIETRYALEAPAAYPDAQGTTRQEVSGGSRSPVARWIDRMQDALESCWRPGRWTGR